MRDLASLRALFAEAWRDPDEAFDEDDWAHTFGGVHFVVRDGGESIVSHASVVERVLHTNGVHLRTGYVEGVATRAASRRRGLGTAVMRDATDHIDASFELGALGTGGFAFYERLGWTRWRGPTGVRTTRGDVPTPEDDGAVMVRLTPRTPPLDLAAPILCDPRSGDVW